MSQERERQVFLLWNSTNTSLRVVLGFTDGADIHVRQLFSLEVVPGVPTGLLGTSADPYGNGEFSLNPNATSSQIGSGDVITEIATNGGVTTQTPTPLVSRGPSPIPILLRLGPRRTRSRWRRVRTVTSS